jgi:putative OPT family oligopeptide transporter
MPQPISGSQQSSAELTVRGLILGLAIGTVMTAANTYLGLYAGMTVSASIPAAIVSMGILRGLLRRGTILENNIVQTIASAGESVAAGIIFTVPALVISGVWTEFPYWKVTFIGLLGGVLGVLFMIPLRRTLIVEDKELIYPEGVACAQVLEAGETGGRSLVDIALALVTGEEIPLFARIVAIADAYDAMTSSRPYRPGRSLEEAIEEIRAYRGKQFAPRVADQFIEALKEETEEELSIMGGTL